MFKIKKNLIIATVGDQSLHKYWMNEKYDLLLINYGNNDYSSDSKYYKKAKGTKFHLIADVLNENPELLANYDYIWMPDDDIYLKPPDINKLFEIATKHELWICQPSIMGWYGLAVTLNQADSHLRYTNYVEIMCPCFKSSIIHKCIDTFKENKSGWGIDALWNIRLDHPQTKLAIIDDVIAIHTRPIGGGDMYKLQTDGSKDNALKEAQDLYVKYNLDEENYQDTKYGKCVSTESFHTLYFNTIEYGKIHRSIEAGLDVKNRLWPKSNEIYNLCENIRNKIKEL